MNAALCAGKTVDQNINDKWRLSLRTVFDCDWAYIEFRLSYECHKPAVNGYVAWSAESSAKGAESSPNNKPQDYNFVGQVNC
jgi:hypothetical protein